MRPGLQARAGTGIDRLHRRESGAAAGIPAQALHGGEQETPVGGELIERAHATTGADDGDQVAGLKLLVDEVLQVVSHFAHALEGQAEVVHNQDDGAAHLLALCRGGRGRGRNRAWGQGSGSGRRRGRSEPYV